MTRHAKTRRSITEPLPPIVRLERFEQSVTKILADDPNVSGLIFARADMEATLQDIREVIQDVRMPGPTL